MIVGLILILIFLIFMWVDICTIIESVIEFGNAFIFIVNVVRIIIIYGLFISMFLYTLNLLEKAEGKCPTLEQVNEPIYRIKN